MTLGGLNCAHCAEVIGQKVSDLDEVEIANLNFVNKKLSFELKDGASRKLTIDKVINIIDTTEPGLNIQVHDNRTSKELKLKLENLKCKHLLVLVLDLRVQELKTLLMNYMVK